MDFVKLLLVAGLITELQVTGIVLLLRSKLDRSIRLISYVVLLMALYYISLLIHYLYGLGSLALVQLLLKDIPLLVILLIFNFFYKNIRGNLKVVNSIVLAVFCVLSGLTLFSYYKFISWNDMQRIIAHGVLLHVTLIIFSGICIFYIYKEKKPRLELGAQSLINILLVLFLISRFAASTVHLIKFLAGTAPNYMFPSYSIFELVIQLIAINTFILLCFRFSADVKKNKYGYSTLEEKEKALLLGEIDRLMQNEKPYLKLNLSLDDIAASLNRPSKHISQVLNELKNQNFSEYLNTYRVEEAKKLLRSNELESKTLEWVQEKTGFASKSSFFNVFKTIVGLTPSEYRKNQSKKLLGGN